MIVSFAPFSASLSSPSTSSFNRSHLFPESSSSTVVVSTETVSDLLYLPEFPAPREDEEENNATPFDEDSAALTGRTLESFVEADSFEKDLGSGSTA